MVEWGGCDGREEGYWGLGGRDEQADLREESGGECYRVDDDEDDEDEKDKKDEKDEERVVGWNEEFEFRAKFSLSLHMNMNICMNIYKHSNRPAATYGDIFQTKKTNERLVTRTRMANEMFEMVLSRCTHARGAV